MHVLCLHNAIWEHVTVNTNLCYRSTKGWCILCSPDGGLCIQPSRAPMGYSASASARSLCYKSHCISTKAPTLTTGPPLERETDPRRQRDTGACTRVKGWRFLKRNQKWKKKWWKKKTMIVSRKEGTEEERKEEDKAEKVSTLNRIYNELGWTANKLQKLFGFP